MLIKTIPAFSSLDIFFQFKITKLFFFYSKLPVRPLACFTTIKSLQHIYMSNNFHFFIKSLQKNGKLDLYRSHLLSIIGSSAAVLAGKLTLFEVQTLSLILKETLFSTIFNFNFFFKFSFHLINKKIRKFSRGKSGKYRLVFNYLPAFKRKKWIIKLLLKSLKLMVNQTYRKKWLHLISLLKYSPNLSLILKIKTFCNNYIFNNKFNSTLLYSL